MLQYFETILISCLSIILMFKILTRLLVIGKMKHEKRKLKSGNKGLKIK